MLADHRGCAPSARGQRSIEIGKAGDIPGGLGVAEQKKTHVGRFVPGSAANSTSIEAAARVLMDTLSRLASELNPAARREGAPIGK